MYLDADDLKTLSATLVRLDGLGGEFNGNLNFTAESGNPYPLEYKFDRGTSRHYLVFPASPEG